MSLKRTSDRTRVDRGRAWYQANARRYDRGNPGLPGDVEFYAGLAHGIDVLEIGAGTGRVTAALTAVARRVLALDNAPEMLRLAADLLRGRENVALIVADARAIPLLYPVDLIVLAYRTVQHLDPDGRRRLWQQARVLLRPSGRIAFDTWHGPATSARGPNPIALTTVAEDTVHRELCDAGLQPSLHRRGFGARGSDAGFSVVWCATRRGERTVESIG